MRLHVLIGALLLVPGSARAQRVTTLDSLLQLNRNGHWAEAATLASRELATPYARDVERVREELASAPADSVASPGAKSPGR